METDIPPTLIVMIRALRPGHGKRRIAQVVGDAVALEVSTQLTRRQIASLPLDGEKVICFTPDEAGDELRREFGDGFRYVAQGVGPLGERLSRISRVECDRNSEGVILLGTDCPELGDERLKQARRSLRTQDAVLGPAWDGGYYLLGFRKWQPELFEGIEWGTETVRTETEERLRRLGWNWELLPMLRDVDTWLDVLEGQRNGWIVLPKGEDIVF
jgi:rSAM/selenodomain-associated transferase 1